MHDPRSTRASVKDTTVVVFLVAGHPYGVRATRTREVLAWRKPRPLPGAESWIEGVINLRGEIIPVCDLARALGLRTRQERTASTSVLIVEMGEGRDCVGFTVDEVRAVTSYGAADVVDAPGADHPAMEGIVRADDELVVLLDPARALDGSADGLHRALAANVADPDADHPRVTPTVEQPNANAPGNPEEERTAA